MTTVTSTTRTLQDTPCPSDDLCGDGKYFIYHNNKVIRCLAEVDVADHLDHGDECGCGPHECPSPCSAVEGTSQCAYVDADGISHDDGQLLCHNPYKKAKSICMSDENTFNHQLGHGLKLGDYCVTDTKPCATVTCEAEKKPKGCECTSGDQCIFGRCKRRKGTKVCK